jgi:hypothetical protein
LYLLNKCVSNTLGNWLDMYEEMVDDT